MDLWDLGILIANRAYQAGRFWKQPWIWRRQKLWGEICMDVSHHFLIYHHLLDHYFIMDNHGFFII